MFSYGNFTWMEAILRIQCTKEPELLFNFHVETDVYLIEGNQVVTLS